MIGKPKTNASGVSPDYRRVPWRSSGNLWLTILVLSGVLTGGRAGAQTRISGGQTQILTNVQTGSAYTLQASDCGKLVSLANTSPVAVTMPQAGTTIPSGCWINLQNAGAGTLTITPAVSTIDGASSVQLASGAGMQVVSSGGQYYSERGAGGGSGGGKVNSGTAGQLGYYPASGSSVSGSGCSISGTTGSDLTCNSLTTTGSLQGEIDLFAASSPSNYVGLAAPATSTTTYTLQFPGIAPANQLLSFGPPSSGISTGSWIPIPTGGGSAAGSVYCLGSGTNTITCPGSPAPSSYVTGMTVSLLAGGTNTGSITLNIAGIGPANVLLNGAAPMAGQVVSGYSYSLYYDGVEFNFINPSVPGLQITFNTAAGTCSPSCTAAATGYGPAGNLPGVTITDNFGLPAGRTRVLTGSDTSGGTAPYPEWGGASASASYRDILNNPNSVVIPFTAPASGTLTDALPGMGSPGAPGVSGAAGPTGPPGAVSFVTNPQSSSYLAQASDFASCKAIPVASGTFTITLVASTSQPASGQCILILNYGSGTVTVARNGQNINGSTSSQVLAAGSASAPSGLLVISDGTNYAAQPLGGTGSGSSGGTGATGATGPAGPVSLVTNPQTSTYQALGSDFASCKSIPVASGTFTITLVAAGSQPASGQCVLILNYGSGAVTVSPSGQNINGSASSQTIPSGSASAPKGLLVISDGVNYEAQPLGASGGSGGGTLTDACSSGQGEWMPWGTTSYTGSFNTTANTIYGWELPANSPLCTIDHIGMMMSGSSNYTWTLWNGSGTTALASTTVTTPSGATFLSTAFASAYQLQANTTYLLTVTAAGADTVFTTGQATQTGTLSSVPRYFTASNAAAWAGSSPNLPSTLGTHLSANSPQQPFVVLFHN